MLASDETRPVALKTPSKVNERYRDFLPIETIAYHLAGEVRLAAHSICEQRVCSDAYD
jgi:hypothetical protein